MTLRKPSKAMPLTVDHSPTNLSDEYRNRADMARSIYVCLAYLMREVEELNDTFLTHCVRQSLDAVGQVMNTEPDHRV